MVVTASEIATIVRGGAGRAALLASKRSGEQPDLSRVAAIRHGLDREPALAAWAAARWPGLTVDERLVVSDTHPRHAATCDMTSAHAVVELKTGVHPWEACPSADRYRDQVLWQMHVTGLEVGVIVYEQHEGGVPVDMEPRVVGVPRDEKRLDELIAAADAFLTDLDNPDVEVPEIDAELDALGQQYLDDKDAESAAKKRKASSWDAMQSRLAKRGTTTQETAGARVTWSVWDEDVSTVDEAAAREANPDLAGMWDALLAAYTTTEKVRKTRLTVTRPKA